jgi:hypothetical protein
MSLIGGSHIGRLAPPVVLSHVVWPNRSPNAVGRGVIFYLHMEIDNYLPARLLGRGERGGLQSL